ncbi:hypothetical protein GCM10010124_33980 [Pilimelia terevasa]|uniref:Secreted protein n=1 Tax=Pilimelia terevasa TaxID=53372 RepID=A0A8J3BPG3_9ACTN|nr:hypothetical protein [Pilimelia terevasa]GGK38338.1 hypothetical protein GCM10010124_33980 [Pilimelia terevasa]
MTTPSTGEGRPSGRRARWLRAALGFAVALGVAAAPAGPADAALRGAGLGCLPREGNSGVLTSVVPAPDNPGWIRLDGWSRHCRPALEDASPWSWYAFGMHSRTGAQPSRMGYQRYVDEREVRRFSTLLDLGPGGVDHVCLHADSVSLHCWGVRVVLVEGAEPQIHVGRPAPVRYRFDETGIPDGGGVCGTCW